MTNAMDSIVDWDLTPQFKVHYEREAETLRLLLQLEKRFREYYDFKDCEIKSQKIIIERLWRLTQRYLILISSVSGCRYPEVYSYSAEEAIINEYEDKLETLRASNNDMKRFVLCLNKECKQFYSVYAQLNKSLETPFIMGDEHHRSITVHKNMVTDIFNYFHSAVLKIKCFMHQLDPVNLESVEDYRELLKKSSQDEETLEYLTNTFVYCKCLEPKPRCPIKQLECDDTKIKNMKHITKE